MDVLLDPRGRKVSGVQFDLLFPLGQVEVLGVQPGTLLGPDPLEVELTESRPGVLVYAVARQGPIPQGTPAGRLATAQLRVLDTVRIGTRLQLLLQAAQIADEDIQRVTEVFTSIPSELVVAAP